MAIHPLFAEAPKEKFGDNFVGRVRTGTQLNGRPMALGTFRFTTGDPELAAAIAEEFGGTPSDWATTGEDNLEVITDVKSIDIQMNSLKSEYLLWGRNGLIRSCDGVTQNDSSDCYCKATYSNQRDWNAANKQGIACGPSVSATFKLSALPDVGIWSFNSQSKTLANGDPAWKRDLTEDGEVYSPPIGEVEAAFADAGSGASANLQLVNVSYTTKAGQAVSFTKPVLTIVEAVAA
jgi:hypothetical protein